MGNCLITRKSVKGFDLVYENNTVTSQASGTKLTCTKDVSKCNVFIGLMYSSWGSYGSGTYYGFGSTVKGETQEWSGTMVSGCIGNDQNGTMDYRKFSSISGNVITLAEGLSYVSGPGNQFGVIRKLWAGTIDV